MTSHPHLQPWADGSSTVMAEVQHSSCADPQTQQHADVIHQHHRRSPLLPHISPLASVCSTAQCGADKLVQTLQASSGIPEETQTTTELWMSGSNGSDEEEIIHKRETLKVCVYLRKSMASLAVLASWGINTDSESLRPSRKISWPLSFACARLTPWPHTPPSSSSFQGHSESGVLYRLHHGIINEMKSSFTHQSLTHRAVMVEGLHQTQEQHSTACWNKTEAFSKPHEWADHFPQFWHDNRITVSRWTHLSGKNIGNGEWETTRRPVYLTPRWTPPVTFLIKAYYRQRIRPVSINLTC